MAARVKSAVAAVASKAKAIVKLEKPEQSHVASNAPAPELRQRLDEEPTNYKDAAKDAGKPQRELRTAYSAAAPAPSGGTLLSGAQPVVPTGTFESRWSGLR